MPSSNYILAAIPLLFPAWVAISLLENPRDLANGLLETFSGSKPPSSTSSGSDGGMPTPSVSSQLLVYSAMGIFGFVLTNRLVPSIKVRVHFWRRRCKQSKAQKLSLIRKRRRCLYFFFLNTELRLSHTRNEFYFYRNIHSEKEYAGKIWGREGQPWLINQCKFLWVKDYDQFYNL